MGAAIIIKVQGLDGVQTQSACIDLILELKSWPPRAVSKWATPLDHEVLQDAVEGQSVVKWTHDFLSRLGILECLLALGQFDKMLNCLRCGLWPKLSS